MLDRVYDVDLALQLVERVADEGLGEGAHLRQPPGDPLPCQIGHSGVVRRARERDFPGPDLGNLVLPWSLAGPADGQPLGHLPSDALDVVAGWGNPNGHSIKEKLDELHTSEINNRRFYPNLDTLIEKVLMDKSKKDPWTNEYSLTNRGESELEARRE